MSSTALEFPERLLPGRLARSDLGGFQRAQYLYRLADLYEKHNGELAKLEAVSMGRPVGTYREGTACASFLRYIAGQATNARGETSLQTAGYMAVTLRAPYGVTAAITPWNAPVTMMTFKIAPAMAAGNTIVVKTSEKAPLTALYIARLAKEAGFPAGVLNILSGFGQPCGEALASHPKVRKISFTGSVRGGRAVKLAAAQSNMKHVTLELGGKSPMIVFEDTDLDKAAQAAATSILLNSGQACVASSRVYVQASIADSFTKKLVAAIRASGTNPAESRDPLAPATKRGPQGDKAQFDNISGFLEEAKQANVQFLTGGQAEEGPGYYIEPTVIFEPAEDSRVMREEIFGPVQCLCTFQDEADVLRQANDSEFGLYASVFTRDIFRALRFAKYFQAGNVGVNVTSPFMTHDMPFGGVKQSGEGKELGMHAVEQWTELKTVYFAMS